MIATVCYIFFFPKTKGKTLKRMNEIFGDQLVLDALQDPVGAELATRKGAMMEHIEDN